MLELMELLLLKEKLAMTEGEVLDASRMSVKQLRAFYVKEIADAKEKDVLLSLHLKATMMKVSDPILFGHCVSVYFTGLFEKHASTLAELGVNPNFGFADVLKKIAQLPEPQRKELEADIETCYQNGPKLAMVDSNRGITNLHVPSDIIIDASMPSMIRGMDGLGGGMWCPDSAPGAKDSHLCDTKALIPDRCYAGVFREAVNFCKENGAFDPSTMGSVPNVGLMAIKAEEYGSHDKTFEVKGDGKIRIVRSNGETLIEHDVETGDVWRACQTKDIAIRDWVKLAVTRGRASGWQVLFWLDPARAHDRNMIALAEKYLKDHDTSGLEIKFMTPPEACRYSLERAKVGENTISVTGNVLRGYNTDLFPILELGTSAKMLSIVPLIAGGGMYETGAGGSAPKHVQQFESEGHLRWDSLGEFLAFACSLEDIGDKLNDDKIKVLAKSLDKANAKYMESNKSPSRKVNEIDNRGSHFYLALYWAQFLAKSTNTDLSTEFAPIAEALSEKRKFITQELIECQGVSCDLGGYYLPDHGKVSALMRPSK